MHLFTRLFATLVSLLLATFILGEPVVLTDKTWKDMLCGQWMVEFYAPWCPSCQHFKPIWAEFAKAMISKEIKVAAVDINDYPSLSGRFGISVLPTIFYVRDGVFRQFHGERSLNGLKNYIEFQEWQRTSPVSPYFAPDSFLMSIVGRIFDVSLLVKDAYTILLEQYGWPAWLIYIVLALAVIFVGLIIGFSVLMIIDCCLTGSSRDEIIDIPDDSRDVDEEDLDDDDGDENEQKQIQTQTKKSKPTLVASSTPQRPSSKTSSKPSRSTPALPVQNDGELLDELLANANDDDDDDDDDDDEPEESQGSDAVEGTDDDNNDQQQQTKQNLRQRRVQHS